MYVVNCLKAQGHNSTDACACVSCRAPACNHQLQSHAAAVPTRTLALHAMSPAAYGAQHAHGTAGGPYATASAFKCPPYMP